MKIKTMAATAAAAAILVTGTLTAASAQAAPVEAHDLSAGHQVTHANGKYLVYAVGYYQPHGGVFTPMQRLGSADSGVRVIGEHGTAMLERDSSVMPGAFETSGDLERGKFAVALLDEQSGLPLRMARIDYPGQTIHLWP